MVKQGKNRYISGELDNKIRRLQKMLNKKNKGMTYKEASRRICKWIKY